MGFEARSVTVSSDGNNVYVASWDDDAVAVFSRDADDNGKLSFVHFLRDNVDGVDGLNGARVVTISPDGNNVYVASYYDSALAVFSRDAHDSGKLSFVHVLKDGVGGVDGLYYARGVTISPDGNNVYLVASGDDAVAVFSRNVPTPPTDAPTETPTNAPTRLPTKMPTASPTKMPTASPTKMPTTSPTLSPSNAPTMAPTDAPVVEQKYTEIHNVNFGFYRCAKSEKSLPGSAWVESYSKCEEACNIQPACIAFNYKYAVNVAKKGQKLCSVCLRLQAHDWRPNVRVEFLHANRARRGYGPLS